MTIKERIERLDAVLHSKNPSMFDYFNPGRSEEEILGILKTNGIRPNESLIALYQWHDGFRAGVPFQALIPNGTLYSLSLMMDSKEELLTWEEIPEREDYWPLIGAFEMDIYALKNSTGEIYFVSPILQILGQKAFESIDSMLQFITECYEEGILPIDRKKLDAGFEKYNDKIVKWKAI